MSAKNLTSEQRKIYDALRVWRNLEAREQDVPPYMILPNETLRQIALEQPVGPEDLLKIEGLSPRKVKRYSRRILAVLHAPDQVDNSLSTINALSQIFTSSEQVTGFVDSDVHSVTVLNKQVLEIIKRAFRKKFSQQTIRVDGEVAAIRPYPENRYFFDLIDENAQITCRYQGDKWPSLSVGVHVECSGTLAISAVQRNQWSILLDVKTIRVLGAGQLAEQQALIRERLEQQGIFDSYRHRALPRYPERIAVITHPDDSALLDIKNRLNSHKEIELELIPVNLVRVSEVVAAIQQADAKSYDLLVLAKTTSTDLDIFDKADLVTVVAHTQTVIATAIGTAETVTLCDRAADFSAPTAAFLGDKIMELWKKESVSPTTRFTYFVLVLAIALFLIISGLVLRRMGLF